MGTLVCCLRWPCQTAGLWLATFGAAFRRCRFARGLARKRLAEAAGLGQTKTPASI